MLLRFILLCIPILTFMVPMRWFSFYAMLMVMVAAVQVAMLLLLREQYTQALSSFGIEVVLGYIVVNVALLALRYQRIRRARARSIKLPAPQAKE